MRKRRKGTHHLLLQSESGLKTLPANGQKNVFTLARELVEFAIIGIVAIDLITEKSSNSILAFLNCGSGKILVTNNLIKLCDVPKKPKEPVISRFGRFRRGPNRKKCTYYLI